MRAAATGAACAFLTAACGAPPMTMTKALFAPSETPPQIASGRFACDIEAVRARLDQSPEARVLAVDVAFAAASEQGLPPHVYAYTRSTPGTDVLRATFSLRPAESRRRWPEDFVANDAVRVGLGMRLQDARYFSDGQPSAEVTFAGTVRQDAVVRRLTQRELPDADGMAVWSGRALPPGLAPVFRAIRRHPWAELAGVGPGSGWRCDPVAWIGASDRVLRDEDVLLLLQPWRSLELGRLLPDDMRVDACALLVRLVSADGRAEYLRVPLALLQEGDDLTLVCNAGEVLWTRCEVWRARMLAEAGDTAQWPVSTLRLAQTRIPYGFDELVYPSTVPGKIVRTLLAPIAWSLDILGWTNPIIQKLLESMVDQPKPITPTRTNR